PHTNITDYLRSFLLGNCIHDHLVPVHPSTSTVSASKVEQVKMQNESTGADDQYHLVLSPLSAPPQDNSAHVQAVERVQSLLDRLSDHHLCRVHLLPVYRQLCGYLPWPFASIFNKTSFCG